MTVSTTVTTSTLKPNPHPQEAPPAPTLDLRVEGEREESTREPAKRPRKAAKVAPPPEPQAAPASLTGADLTALGLLWQAAHAAGFGDRPGDYVESLRAQVAAYDKLVR